MLITGVKVQASVGEIDQADGDAHFLLQRIAKGIADR